MSVCEEECRLLVESAETELEKFYFQLFVDTFKERKKWQS